MNPTRFLSPLIALSLSAAPLLKPEAPITAQASALYTASTLVLPASPTDILKWQDAGGDPVLAMSAVSIRWAFDRMADGELPDENVTVRMLSQFRWDEAGVLRLHQAGIDRELLLCLAKSKPLALRVEAQQRLSRAGVDPRVISALASKPLQALPPMKRISDMMMEGMPPALAQNPAFKAQMASAQASVERQIKADMGSEKTRNSAWAKVLDNWRSRIQVGSDPKAILAPVSTEIVGATAQPQEDGGLMDTAQAGNNILIKSGALGKSLAVAQVVSILQSKALVQVRPTDPADVLSVPVNGATCFALRRKPTDLMLVRIKDVKGIQVASFTKGTFMGRKFKTADEKIAVETSQEDGIWVVKPTAPLTPGTYAFIAGNEDITLVPFVIQ